MKKLVWRFHSFPWVSNSMLQYFRLRKFFINSNWSIFAILKTHNLWPLSRHRWIIPFLSKGIFALFQTFIFPWQSPVSQSDVPQVLWIHKSYLLDLKWFMLLPSEALPDSPSINAVTKLHIKPQQNPEKWQCSICPGHQSLKNKVTEWWCCSALLPPSRGSTHPAHSPAAGENKCPSTWVTNTAAVRTCWLSCWHIPHLAHQL